MSDKGVHTSSAVTCKSTRRMIGTGLVQIAFRTTIGAVMPLCSCRPAVNVAFRASLSQTIDGKLFPKEQRLVVFPRVDSRCDVSCAASIRCRSPRRSFRACDDSSCYHAEPTTDAKTADVQRLNHIHSLRQLKEGLPSSSVARLPEGLPE
jgi:hypothetical protein